MQQPRRNARILRCGAQCESKQMRGRSIVDLMYKNNSYVNRAFSEFILSNSLFLTGILMKTGDGAHRSRRSVLNQSLTVANISVFLEI
jgi:hypothetical protein